MYCDICSEPFDHSIRKPFVLSSCGHTYCSWCLKQFNDNKCPQCRKVFKEKNPNIALLNLIPESNYDNLKAKSLKAFGDIDKDLKCSRDYKLQMHEAKLKSIKQIVFDETFKLIGILRANEKKLTNECNTLFNEIKIQFDTNFVLPSLNGVTKEAIQNNELNEDQLNEFNNKIPELKQEFNRISDLIKNYQFNYEFELNKISNENLLAGDLNTVIINFNKLKKNK